MELALIGYPVSHSQSPWIHQRFLNQIKTTGRYQLIEIAPDQFETEIKKMKSMPLIGFNVTIPYKEKIMPYLDEISADAEEIGAVNTVVCHNQKWFGYNTDGVGLTTALKTQYPNLFQKDKSVLLLGAGGASRGIYHALLKEDFANISIANRTLSRAENVMELNVNNKPGEALSFQEAEQTLDQYDLVIQTTSVGMTPNETEQVIDLERLKQGAVVSDIVYQPFLTALLKSAKEKGARIHHGHEMLLYQAKLAFELWTNETVSVEPLIDEFIQMINIK